MERPLRRNHQTITATCLRRVCFVPRNDGSSLSKMLLLAILLSTLTHLTQAQTRGRVEVVKDPRVDTLIAKRSTLNKMGGGAVGHFGTSSYGYRVQFFSGASRKAAFEAQNKVQQGHPGIRTYIIYRDPNYKVKAGNFRSRMEAVKLMEELKGTFPIMFIISEKIDLPKLDTNTTEQ